MFPLLQRRWLPVALLLFVLHPHALADAPPPLKVRLDKDSRYLILASTAASRDFAKAIAIAQDLHPEAAVKKFNPDDLPGAKAILKARQPHYVLLFLKPQELDVNFAWQWLELCTQLNDDPLVDACTGIITGASPEDAAAFMQRISDAAQGKSVLPASFIDNLGPNPQADKTSFQQAPASFIIPVLGQRLALGMISHGPDAFTDARLATMGGAGLVHFGGHGHPDRIDDGLRAAQIAKTPLAPCVVFNGACYTGATYRWFDEFTENGKVQEKTVPPGDSFCLNLLKSGAVAYFAALHPDHGMPVYQEMEYLAYSGASLGEVMKHTYDGVIVASGGKLPKLEKFKDGAPAPRWSPSDVMLNGTASRVLFGDPAMVVTDAFTAPPFRVEVKNVDSSLAITATVQNPALKSTFTDTFFSDLSRDKMQFNDRAWIAADLPADWKRVGSVAVARVTADGKAVPHRLVGYAYDADHRRLYVQVDVASEGFMQSPIRTAGAAVELKIGK